jgi:hypothetical protein
VTTLSAAIVQMEATFKITNHVRALRLWRQSAQKRTLSLVVQRSRRLPKGASR